MARIISIDFGTKRCGMAITDPLQISINPLPTVYRKSLLESTLKKLESEDVETLVIGLPTHRDGSFTYLKKEIDIFISQLKKQYKSEIKIEFIDESFSSVEAKDLILSSGFKKKDRQKKELVDQMSAMILLKRYLNY